MSITLPVSDCPLTKEQKHWWAVLPVKVTNTHSEKHARTYGYIDTGASYCTVPASMAKTLGHNLIAGEKREIITAAGRITAYLHSTKLEFYNPINDRIIHIAPHAPVAFIPDLPFLLIGIQGFLEHFCFSVNYPDKCFSLVKRRQLKKKRGAK